MFKKGEKVFLKVSPMKGVIQFNKKHKLHPRYIWPFEVLKKMRLVVHKLAFPLSMSSFYPLFYMLMLKKYYGDDDYFIYYKPELFDKELSYEEESIPILAKYVRKLRTQFIP